LAVEVLVAIGEREAAERRAPELLQTMVDREQLSLRQAVAVARRHDQPPQRQPTSSNSRGPTRVDVARVTGMRVDPAGGHAGARLPIRAWLTSAGSKSSKCRQRLSAVGRAGS
jgi:hypothetical protein